MERNKLEGKRFNRLSVVGFKKGKSRILWECVCDCGKTSFVAGFALKSGAIKSCGCLASEIQSARAIKRNTTHGQNKAGKQTRTHKTWSAMLYRCRNNGDKNYGGRGISVCERWHSFVNFLEDMGARPHGKTIDRINVDGEYCKENCRWATRSEQQRNRRDSMMVSINGEVIHVSEAAERIGIKPNAMRERITRVGVSAAFAMGGNKR